MHGIGGVLAIILIFYLISQASQSYAEKKDRTNAEAWARQYFTLRQSLIENYNLSVEANLGDLEHQFNSSDAHTQSLMRDALNKVIKDAEFEAEWDRKESDKWQKRLNWQMRHNAWRDKVSKEPVYLTLARVAWLFILPCGIIYIPELLFGEAGFAYGLMTVICAPLLMMLFNFKIYHLFGGR